MESKIIIALGSNFEQQKNMEEAKRRLYILFPDIVFSRFLWTNPIGIKSDRFVNALALAHSALSQSQIEWELKEIERRCGRCAEEKAKGIIRLDLDLMQYGKEKLHQEDWKRGYVLELLEDMDVYF